MNEALSLPLSTQLIQPLVQNAILLLALTFAFSLFTSYLRRLSLAVRSYLTGALLGLFTLFLTPIPIQPGIFVDGRTIMVAVAGAFGGWRGAIAALAIMIPYRLSQGGVAAPLSVVSMIACALVGIYMYLRNGAKDKGYTAWQLIAMSLVVTLIRLVLPFALPWETARNIFEQTALPTILMTLPTIVLLGLLLQREQRRVHLEQILAVSDRAFRTSLSGTIVVDGSGRIMLNNPALREMFGYAQSAMFTLVGKPIETIIAPSDHDGLRREMDRVYKMEPHDHDNKPFECHGVRQDGTEFPMTLALAPLRAQNGTANGFVISGYDLTERKNYENRLQTERNWMRTLIDTLPDAVYIKDADGRYLIANTATAHALGLESPEEMIGKSNHQILPPSFAERIEHEEEDPVLREGKPIINREREMVDLYGRDKGWYLISKVPLRDVANKIVGLVGVSRDITVRKQYEAHQLEVQVERERVAMMRQFLADASHDLRTPLSIMNTSLYLLRRSVDDGALRYVESIEAEAAHILRLIDDLFMLSRLDLAQNEFEFDECDPQVLLADVAYQHHGLTVSKKHTVKFDVPSDIDTFSGAPHELKRVLGNLFLNALNFTPDGGQITLAARSSPSEMTFEVRDNGIGIHSDDLPHIFERFYRADKARNTDTGGSGLGLAIAQKIIEAHHGRIEVKSVPGDGSVFRVILPRMHGTSEPETPRETILQSPAL